MKLLFAFILTGVALTACVKDEAPNPEADILAITFPENTLRTKEVEINNDFITAYPKRSVNLRETPITSIEVTPGATYRIDKESPALNDTLFFIYVTSESKVYTKRYSIVQSNDFPNDFDFEVWTTPNTVYQFENPKSGSLQWYSSNNGAAIAWNSSVKKACDYLVRRISKDGSTAAELVTMTGPGWVGGGNTYIPCLAGSLYLGGFNPLTGLIAPLKSTRFGVPFNNGKPTRFKGYYSYKEGTEDFINSDGTADKTKRDICSIYAIIYKTDENVQFLYGDDIADSPNVIARAELQPGDIVQKNDFSFFDVAFDYDSYPAPFVWDELEDDLYKVSIVFSSSSRGQHYEGRPGSTLIVDQVSLLYDTTAP